MSEIKQLLNNNSIKNKLFNLINNCSYRAKEKLKKNSVKRKEDGSLVTDADKDIDEAIRKGLMSITPSIPIISEESNYNDKYFLEEAFWLVDPIDGTAGYVKGEDSYTINIGLVYKGTPVLGIISNPPSNTIWFGRNDESLVYKNSLSKKIKTISSVDNVCKIIMSKTYHRDTSEFIKKIQNTNVHFCSSSIKFCKIAQGEANIYPRLTSLSKWDIAAGEAILKASGGIVLDSQGNELNYSTSSIKTGKFFALSSKSLWNQIISHALNNN